MSSLNNTYIEILTVIPIFLHRYVATILYFIGNLGNLFSLVIFFKRSWRKNVCAFYCIICLISNLVFINSSLFGSILIFGFDANGHNSNAVLCKLFYYISFLSSTYYPIVLIFASFDRLLISSQNVDTRLYSSKRLAYLFVSTNFVFWTIFTFHILIKVNIQQFGVGQFVCTYDLSQSYLNFLLYSTFTISALIPLVLIILSILAFKNVRRIRANPSKKRGQTRVMHKKDFQLLRCLYIHNIVYIICSILITVGLYYKVTVNYKTVTPMQQAVYDFVNNFGLFIHYIPYCTSFFIFVCVSKAFRQELKRMSYKICGKEFVIARQEENQQQEAGRENVELNNVVVSTIALPH